MAIITPSDGLQFGLGSGITQRTYGIVGDARATGSMQYVMSGESRWMMTIASPKIMRPAEAGRWRSMLLSLRGRVNHLACWDPGRALPVGTARSAMTLGVAAAKGASAVTIAGGNGTLIAGDWLQVGALGLGTSQLVCLVADAVVPGVVQVEPPLRRSFGGGTAVVFNRASSLFKLTGSDLPDFVVSGSAGQMAGLRLNLLEQWS
jgi:hypothetical protein